MAKKIFVLIDEIQYLNSPANFIKLITDHYKNFKLIVSGSSTFEIRKKMEKALVGSYPKIALLKIKEKKEKYLSQIINTYLKKDIRNLAGIKEIEKYNLKKYFCVSLRGYKKHNKNLIYPWELKIINN